MQGFTISASTRKPAPFRNAVLAMPISDASWKMEPMSIRSLMASSYVIVAGLFAGSPSAAASDEFAEFSSGTGRYVVEAQERGASQIAAAQQAQEERTAKRQVQREAKIADVRGTYDPMLETQMMAAQPVGFLGKMFGGTKAETIGAWSGSTPECATNRLLFFEDANAEPAVAWWTQPLSLRDGGLIPSLTGEWEVRDNVIVISFDETTIDQPFTGGGVSTKPTKIGIQLEVTHDEDGKLRLGVPGGNLTLAAAELLDGASEKSFIRCANPS